jgi:hypothetical protein
MGKLKFSEGVKLLVDFHTARDRDTKKVEGRIAKHLTPYFGANRLMASITGDLVAAYIAKRKKDAFTTKKGVVKGREERHDQSRAGMAEADVYACDPRREAAHAAAHRTVARTQRTARLLRAGAIPGRVEKTCPKSFAPSSSSPTSPAGG